MSTEPSPTCVSFNGPRLSSPEVTVATSTIDFENLQLEFFESDIEGGKRVDVHVPEPGHWLLRVWYGLTPSPTEDPAIRPPSNEPAASMSYRVTDANGNLAIDVLSADPASWYVRAVVCGKVSVSQPITIGI